MEVVVAHTEELSHYLTRRTAIIHENPEDT